MRCIGSFPRGWLGQAAGERGLTGANVARAPRRGVGILHLLEEAGAGGADRGVSLCGLSLLREGGDFMKAMRLRHALVLVPAMFLAACGGGGGGGSSDGGSTGATALVITSSNSQAVAAEAV